MLGKHDYNVLGLAISPQDGRYLASVSGWGCGDVRVWDLQTGRDTQIEHGAAVGSIAFAPDNRTIAFGVRSGEVIIWDVVDGEEQKRIPGHQAERRGALTFMSDGRLAVADVSGVITIWDLTDDKPIKLRELPPTRRICRIAGRRSH